MSSYINRIQIFGLWSLNEESIIDIPINEKYNFFIGPNGSGKTTIINLVAAAITANFQELDKIIFNKIIINIFKKENEKEREKISIIEVKKSLKENLPFNDIHYRIFPSEKSDPIVFDLDLYEDIKFIRHGETIIRHPQRYRPDRSSIRYDIRECLKSIINVNWLSVYRQTDYSSEKRDKNSSDIDSKLESMLIELTKLFSKNDSEFAAETQKFQKKSFQSLTATPKTEDVQKLLNSIDIEKEKRSLESIFNILQVDSIQAKKQAEHITDSIESSKSKLEFNTFMSIDDAMIISNIYKAHILVQQYESLQKKKKQIYSNTENFIKTINELYKPRKQIEISKENQIQINKKKDLTVDQININHLSSGEKQLLIILGQAFLQEGKPITYIADEPEISLHIEWQEKLTDAITKINPNAQIIFATHSPDIVGRNNKYIIKIEGYVE